MKLKAYPLVERALEEGAQAGWNRAHKYTDTPTAEAVRDEIVRAQMLELSEILDWEDDFE
jgi:hypothetical protein